MIRNVLIAKCEYCGRMNCVGHHTYTDRCEECGKRYAKYSNYKSLQRSRPTVSRGRLLDNIILEYKDLKFAGYKVPHDIE